MVHDYKSVSGNYGFGSAITVECYVRGALDNQNESITALIYITLNGKERNNRFNELLRMTYDDAEYSCIQLQELAGYRRRYLIRRIYVPDHWSNAQFLDFFDRNVRTYRRNDWVRKVYRVQDGGYVHNVTYMFDRTVEDVMNLLKDAGLIDEAN